MWCYDAVFFSHLTPLFLLLLFFPHRRLYGVTLCLCHTFRFLFRNLNTKALFPAMSGQYTLCVCVCVMVALPTAGFTARHPGWWHKILGCLSRARWIGLLLLLFLFCLDSVENVYSIQLKTAALFKVSV